MSRPSRAAWSSALGLLLGFTGFAAAWGWRVAEQRSLELARYVDQSPIVELPRPWWVETHDYVVGLWWAHQLVRRVAPRSLPDEERVVRLATWMFEHFIGGSATLPVREDHFFNTARRGYGYCDQLSHVLATLYWSAGYPVRLRMLRAATGESPHTVTEVRLQGRWIIADSYFKMMLRDAQGRFVSVEDFVASPQLFHEYQSRVYERTRELYGGGKRLQLADFQRGYLFTTAPYMPWSQMLRKIWSRLWTSPNPMRPAPPVPTGHDVAGAARPIAPEPETRPAGLEGALRRLDRARWDELLGRDASACALYSALVASDETPESVRSVARYWLARSAWRLGDTQACQKALQPWPALVKGEQPWHEASHVMWGRCGGTAAAHY